MNGRKGNMRLPPLRSFWTPSCAELSQSIEYVLNWLSGIARRDFSSVDFFTKNSRIMEFWRAGTPSVKLNGVFVASLSRYFYVTHRLSDDLVSKPREKKILHVKFKNYRFVISNWRLTVISANFIFKVFLNTKFVLSECVEECFQNFSYSTQK